MREWKEENYRSFRYDFFISEAFEDRKDIELIKPILILKTLIAIKN